MDDLGDGHRVEVNSEVNLLALRGLVRRVDAGEALDLAGPGGLVKTLAVVSLAVLQRGGDVDKEEGSARGTAGPLDNVTSGRPRASVGRGRGGDDGGAGTGQLSLKGEREGGGGKS